MNKQFNLKGLGGVYLSYRPQVEINISNYREFLLENYDFFPTTSSKSNLWEFKNSRYEDSGIFLGSNSTQKSNSNLTYSEILYKDSLIQNKIYYNEFKFYFRFYGSTLSGYSIEGMTSTLSKKILDRLRVKLYAQIGSNTVSLNFSDLEKYDGVDWVAVDSSDVTGSGDIEGGDYGIQLTTGLNSESCVDMAYENTTQMNELFNEYSNSPEGYNFRVHVSFPDFTRKSDNGKNYKLIVRYFNIGVSGASSPYDVSETIDLISENKFYYLSVISIDDGGGGI